MKQEIILIVNRELLANIGPRVFVSEIAQKDLETYLVSLGVQKPLFIDDATHNKRYLKFIKFNSIYDFEVSKEKKKISINKRQLYDATVRNFKLLNLSSEKIILESVYDKLVAIPLVRTSLTPVYDILSKIVRDKKISQETIKAHYKKERYLNYITFLEQLGIIRKDINGNIVEGNIPIIISKEANDPEKMIAKLFGYAIREGKGYLISQLKIYSLSPFLPVVNTYYQMACAVGHIITTTLPQMKNTFEELYYPIDQNKFQNNVAQLCDAGILVRKDNTVSGDSAVLQKVKQVCAY